jgi:hypothetical protein
MGIKVTAQSPSQGYIAWTGASIAYKGATNAIADGNTNYIYVYWLYSDPTHFYGTNTYPTLGVDDILVFVNKNGVPLIVPNTTVIDGSLVVPQSLTANAIAANTITATQLAAGSVTATQIAAGAISANAIAANAIGTNALAAGAIVASKIATDTITATQLAAGAVTASELAAGAVTANSIAAGAITANAIAANAIGANAIAAGAITADKLAVGALDAQTINSGVFNLINNGTFKAQTSGIGTSFYISSGDVRGMIGGQQAFYGWYDGDMATFKGFDGNLSLGWIEAVFAEGTLEGGITTTGLANLSVNDLHMLGGYEVDSIYDQGSNSNGAYIRYNNGIQIAWTTSTVTNQACSGAYGSLFQGSRTWTFPISFYARPAVTCSEFKWGTSASWGTLSGTPTTTSADIRIMDAFTRATGTNTNFSCIAIGTWK